jgi:hypothetical protein
MHLEIVANSLWTTSDFPSSSNACPFGCGENIILFAGLKRLETMEEEALAAVKAANEELIEARATVARLSSGIAIECDQKAGDLSASNVEDVAGLSSNKKDEDANKKDSDAITKYEDNTADRVDLEDGTGKLSKETKGLRQRSKPASQWEHAKSVAREMQSLPKKAAKKGRAFSSGSCRFSLISSWHWLTSKSKGAAKKNARFLKKSGRAVVSVVEHPSYAVVTFTSRQAAIAARQCLADGGGLDRWVEIEEIPVAPLADAPPCNIMFCRGCCRPVTLTISDNEKTCRRYM